MTDYNYELKPFTNDTMAATRNAWGKEVCAREGEILSTQYERILQWAEDHIDYSGEKSQTFAYGIFGRSAHDADAIVELIYTKSGAKWMKLLDVHLSPSVDFAFAPQEVDLKRLMSIFAAGMDGTVHLASTVHPSNVTKMYGRSGTLLEFLKEVGTVKDNSALPGLKVSIEGRWLVFRDEGEAQG
jgi:hypothetical protein